MDFQLDGRELKRLASTGRQDAARAACSVSELFHENTKLAPLSYRWYCTEIGRLVKAPEGGKSPYKIYSLGPQLPLPSVEPATPVERGIAGRRSGRAYDGSPLLPHELSRLLFYSYGLTDRAQGRRAVASAGALYPLEVYALALAVAGLDRGIYHYNVENHSLDAVERGERLAALDRCVSFADVQIERAALVLVVTGLFGRSTFKYKDRGYRLVLMEAGSLAQNLCLVANRLGLDACLLGGFLDDELSRLLGIDGQEEAPLLPVVVGRSAEAR